MSLGTRLMVSAVLFTSVIAGSTLFTLFAYNTTTVAATTQPLIGAIRWDAWRENNADYGVAQSLYTDWSYRQPFYGWFNVNVPNHQQIIDQEITYAADNGIDYWAYIWYPERSNTVDLMNSFRDYLASPYKTRLKFAFILQPNAGYGAPDDPNGYEYYWRSESVPLLVSMFQDPQYVKVEGNRPVIFWFDVPGSAQQPNGFGDGLADELAYLRTQTQAAGLGDPVIIDNNMNVAAAQTYGLQGVTSYGPSGAVPSGTTATRCWDDQAVKDSSNWSASGTLLTIPGLTPVNDPRPRNYGYSVQHPTYTQWEQHLKNAFAWTSQNPTKTTNPPLLLVYAWNEIDEGGPGIVPTLQDGTKYLSAIKAVKSGIYPNTYSDTYNGDNCAFQFTGNWIYYFPVSGNYQNDEQISTATGDTTTLSSSDTVGFEIFGTKGPNRGKMEVYIDNVSKGTINLNQTAWAVKQSLFKSSSLIKGTHTIKIINRSDIPEQNQVGIDSMTVDISHIVPPPIPTATFVAAPTSTISGGSATLTWSSTDTTTCDASGGWSGTKTSSGTQTLTNLTTTQTYTLTCSGAGGSVQKSTSIVVIPPPPVETILEYNGNHTSIVRTGNWIAYPVTGNYKNDEQISQKNGDTLTLQVQKVKQFEVTGTKGPNRGKMEVYIDNVSKGTINLNQTAWAVKQSLFKSAVLPIGTHTIKIVNRSTLSTQIQVGIDSFKATIVQ